MGLACPGNRQNLYFCAMFYSEIEYIFLHFYHSHIVLKTTVTLILIVNKELLRYTNSSSPPNKYRNLWECIFFFFFFAALGKTNGRVIPNLAPGLRSLEPPKKYFLVNFLRIYHILEKITFSNILWFVGSEV